MIADRYRLVETVPIRNTVNRTKSLARPGGRRDAAGWAGVGWADGWGGLGGRVVGLGGRVGWAG